MFKNGIKGGATKTILLNFAVANLCKRNEKSTYYVYYRQAFYHKLELPGMILLDNKLIHKDILEECFTCDLNSCKGACCREGEFGAPLDEAEINLIDDILDTVLELLPEENRRAIEKKGFKKYYPKMEKTGTALKDNGACVFFIENGNSPGQCAFEKAKEEGMIEFKKPISCHLYPIRIERNETVDMDYLNYDRWDICSAACSLGKKLKMPLFEFCREALERKYGSEITVKLRELSKALNETSDEVD